MARRPLWLWPNLLSLDAPIVALVWFWMYKQVWLVKYHQPTLPWFLALAVWCIYVGDRLMDERLAGRDGGRPTARHGFHRQHRGSLKLALAMGIFGALFLLAIQSRGLHIHGLPILLPVLAYFVVSFSDGGRNVSFFKNILAGVAFAYGVAVGVHFRRERPFWDLALSPEVVVFAGLCIINMIAIDHWESSSRGKNEKEEPGEQEREHREVYRALLLGLLLVLIVSSYLLAVRAEDYTLQTHKAFYLSIIVGAGGLGFLVLLRDLFSSDLLRVLADVAMVLPLPFFYFYLVDYEIIEFGHFSWNLTAPGQLDGG